MRAAPEELRTSRLVLSPLVVDDASTMLGVLADPELYTYTGGAPPTEDELVSRYRTQVAGSGNDRERWYNWIMRLHDGGAAVGFVQATVIGGEADVAWVVGLRWQGQGLAKEAVATMNDWLVATGVRRISAHIHPDHLASQRVANSAGLTRTGRLDSDGEEIWAHAIDPVAGT